MKSKVKETPIKGNESKKVEGSLGNLQTHGDDVSAVVSALGTVKTDIETLMAAWTFAGAYEAAKMKEMHLLISRWYSSKQGQ
jgi:hypothetical protein